jgi:hypothetical protein
LQQSNEYGQSRRAMNPGNVVFTTSLQEPGYTCQDLRQTQAHNKGQEDHQELEQVHAVN